MMDQLSSVGIGEPIPAEKFAGDDFLDHVARVAKDTASLMRPPTLGAPGAIIDRATTLQQLAPAFDAAERSQRLAGTISSRAEAENEIYDNIIGRIRAETGVNLQNPRYMPVRESVNFTPRRIGAAISDPDTLSIDDRMNNNVAEFMRRAREVKASNPDKLRDLDLDTDPIEQAAQAARRAQRDGDKLSEQTWSDGGNVAAAGLASFAGALWGSRRDPALWMSLPFGGPGAAETAMARILTSAISNAAINAGFSAASQPAIQAWRREAGLPNGLSHALADVALSGAFGAVLGGGVEGLRALNTPLRRVVDGTPAKGDYERLAKAGLFVDEETRDALRGARMAHDADALAGEIAPNVPRETAARVMPDAIAHLEDPLEPPPISEPLWRNAPASERARAIIDNAPDRDRAIADLRVDPEAARAAMSDAHPENRLAARLAMLPEEAYALVRDGKIDPVHASAIAPMAEQRADAIAMAHLLAEQRPLTVRDARIMIRDALAAERAQDMQAAILAAPRRAGQKSDQSLFQFLAANGGLKPHADLQAMFDGNPFVPGYGRLVRKGGMSLDEAVERAREAGYFFDPGDVEGQLRHGINDLQDLLDREHRGQRVYAQNSERVFERFDDMRDAEFWRGEYRAAVEDELAKVDGLDGAPRDMVDAAADLLMRGRESDPLIAFERAVMEDYYRSVADADGAIRQQGAAHAGQEADAGMAPPEGARAAGASDAAARSRRRADPPREQSVAAGNDQGAQAQPAKAEMMDLVAVPGDNGIEFLPRTEIENRIARESFFADVVGACKL